MAEDKMFSYNDVSARIQKSIDDISGMPKLLTAFQERVFELQDEVSRLQKENERLQECILRKEKETSFDDDSFDI